MYRDEGYEGRKAAYEACEKVDFLRRDQYLSPTSRRKNARELRHSKNWAIALREKTLLPSKQRAPRSQRLITLQHTLTGRTDQPRAVGFWSKFKLSLTVLDSKDHDGTAAKTFFTSKYFAVASQLLPSIRSHSVNILKCLHSRRESISPQVRLQRQVLLGNTDLETTPDGITLVLYWYHALSPLHLHHNTFAFSAPPSHGNLTQYDHSAVSR